MQTNQNQDMTTTLENLNAEELNDLARDLEENNAIQLAELVIHHSRQRNATRTPEQQREYLIVGKKIELLRAKAHLARLQALERAKAVKK